MTRKEQSGCTSTTHIVSASHIFARVPSFASLLAGPESNNGQNLLCRTEFHSQSEYRSSVTIARRMKGEDMVAPQAKLICGKFSGVVCIATPPRAQTHSPGHPDGSLTALVPVDETTFKRLHLLQGQLTRNVQHIAGLNPRAFRYELFFFLSLLPSILTAPPAHPASFAMTMYRNRCRMEFWTDGCWRRLRICR